MKNGLEIELLVKQNGLKDPKIEKKVNSIAKHKFKTEEILAKEHIENMDVKLALADQYVKKYGKVKNLYIDGFLFGLGMIIIALLVQQF